jgi:hypothetical protein
LSTLTRTTNPDPAPAPASRNPFQDPGTRRAYLDREAFWRTLGEEDRDFVRLGRMTGFWRWLEQIRATGGCSRPIYLAGSTTTYDRSTGRVVRSYSTFGEPGGRLAVRCRNRRASVCPSCSWEYQGDTFHLVRAGLVGGKGIPETVRDRPRLFLTLTAPSFGPVHREGECHAERAGFCHHARPRRCTAVHPADDPAVGQPVCADCYDYTGHVLWNAHAPALWKAFRDNLYHHLAARVGAGRSEIRRLVRVSAAKVAEYQKRGAIHFHEVLRLDGPDGPDSPPPQWASAELLAECARTAAAAVALPAPVSAAYGERRLRFGEQLEVHAIGNGDGSPLGDEQVAAYVAKYTSKSVEAAGAVDRRITSGDDIPHLHVTDHVRALIGTAWRLGGLPELEHLRLRMWAHMLGYRGHCLTKTRAYSTTYGALRAARAEHARTANERELYADWDDETETVSTWWYVASGYSPAEALVAAGIAEDLARNREIAKEESLDERVRGRP